MTAKRGAYDNFPPFASIEARIASSGGLQITASASSGHERYQHDRIAAESTSGGVNMWAITTHTVKSWFML